MSGLDEGWVVVEEARLALQAGDPDGAIDQARQAIELLGTQSAPGELGDAYLVLARGYDELGRTDRAEAAYASAIDALRKQNGWHCELGRAYRWYGKFLRRAGRAEAAMDAFEQAADLAPVEPRRPRAPGSSSRPQHWGLTPMLRPSAGEAALVVHLDGDVDRQRAARPRLEADPLAQERAHLAPDRDERHRDQDAREPVQLAGRQEGEDHDQRVHLDGAPHQLGDDDVALDLVDEEEEERDADDRRPPTPSTRRPTERARPATAPRTG